MYCAHPVSGTGNNSLMYCYNMKPVSTVVFVILPSIKIYIQMKYGIIIWFVHKAVSTSEDLI